MATMTISPRVDASPKWIRITGWCEATNMPRKTTYQLIESGELRAVRVGGRYYIPESETVAFFERAADKAAA